MLPDYYRQHNLEYSEHMYLIKVDNFECKLDNDRQSYNSDNLEFMDDLHKFDSSKQIADYKKYRFR